MSGALASSLPSAPASASFLPPETRSQLVHLPDVQPTRAIPYVITPERRAMLNTIRFAEGTWKGGFDVGYRVMFGGGLMSSLNRHPNRVIYSSRYASAAAGAYQFMPFTWDLVRRSLGVTGLRTGGAGSRGAVLDSASQGSWSHRLGPSFPPSGCQIGAGVGLIPHPCGSEFLRATRQKIRSPSFVLQRQSC
jgi:hypothetical protein